MNNEGNGIFKEILETALAGKDDSYAKRWLMEYANQDPEALRGFIGRCISGLQELRAKALPATEVSPSDIKVRPRDLAQFFHDLMTEKELDMLLRLLPLNYSYPPADDFMIPLVDYNQDMMTAPNPGKAIHEPKRADTSPENISNVNRHNRRVFLATSAAMVAGLGTGLGAITAAAYTANGAGEHMRKWCGEPNHAEQYPYWQVTAAGIVTIPSALISLMTGLVAGELFIQPEMQYKNPPEVWAKSIGDFTDALDMIFAEYAKSAQLANEPKHKGGLGAS